MPDEALLPAYREADRRARVRQSRIGCWLLLVLMPAGISLDWFVYPENIRQLLLVRLVSGMVLLPILALHSVNLGQRWIGVLTFAWLSVAVVAVAYMIQQTEGASSTYYAGIALTVIAIGILLPVTVPEVAVFFVGTIAVYVFACLASAHPLVVSDFFNNLYFLALSGIISLTAAYFGTRQREQEFRMNWDLEARNRELTQLDRLKSEFFANISHELRTPLTLILAPVQELLQGSWRLPDAVATRLGVVRNNALRLLKLVNDLLDVIRLEEGRDALEKSPQDLGTLLGGLTESMVHLADTKSVTLTKDLDSAPMVVLGDAAALEKVFINLTNNALKFTEPGGSVTIRARRGSDHVEVEVADTGIGIDAVDLPHIFERFRQADGSVTRRYQGTGLGLALVKELVEKHGGIVSVHSKLGVGTRMRVRLPLAPAPVGVAAESEALPTAAPLAVDALQALHSAAERTAGLTVEEPNEDEALPSTRDPKRPRVLVVDDEPDMRRYLLDLLAEDYQVIAARDGDQGLQYARFLQPDLMLLDLMLPGIDGLEVCRRLKEDPETRRIKLMLLTARADETAKLTALAHGADDFLTKPFSSVEVKTRLRNLYATAGLERDLDGRNRELEHTLHELKRTQARLLQSEKLNALGSLSAGLLHEINNPLNYTLTALQLVAADPAVQQEPLLREAIADIDEGMGRIRNIVCDLRAFAYPSEAEKQVEFDLIGAIRSALNFTAHECRGIVVELDAPDAAEVCGSKSHVVQVMVNLLTNAANAVRDAARGNAAAIRVRVWTDDGRVRVAVADNGVGMSPEVQAQAFDPFFTTRDVGAGMGLGLSICHTIVANHGGEMSVTSAPGEGSEFRFDFPPAQPPTEPEAPCAMPRSTHSNR